MKTADTVFGLQQQKPSGEPQRLFILKARQASRTSPEAGWDDDPLEMAETPPERSTRLIWGSWDTLLS